MKKRVLCIALFLVLSFSFVSAISTDLKSTYEPGETVITKLSGSILQTLTLDQIKIKRDNVEVPVEYGINKLQDDYYLWFIAPKIISNYTLLIKDLSTTLNGNPTTLDFMQNFSAEGNLSSYSIQPGAISTKKDFQIELILNEDTPKSIDISFPVPTQLTLNPGKNTVYFSIAEQVGKILTNIQIGKYSVPAYIIGNSSPEVQIETQPIKFTPRAIESILLLNEKPHFTFQIINSGIAKYTGLSLNYNKSLFQITPDSSFYLEKGEIINFNLTVKEKRNVNEKISLVYPNYTTFIEVKIDFVNETAYQNKTSLNQIKTTLFKCAELSGTICEADEICSGELVSSIDGLCCTKECNKESKPSYKWYGYAILGVLILIVAFIYIKFKKAK